MQKKQFAEILPPQKIGFGKATLTYEIPAELTIKPGQIVHAPLRNRKIKGIVHSIHTTSPKFRTKTVEAIVENAPHLEPYQLQLLDFISEYYHCPLFKALKLFIPAGIIKKKNVKSLPLINLSADPTEIKFKHTLYEEQKNAIKIIEETNKTVTVLHGITGSGKTEVYLNILEKHVKAGHQVLLLIPEISLTAQTLRKFQNFFHEEIAVIHSQLTPKQKEDAWKKIHAQKVKIVIGSRSAIFAPFKDLKYIVIDEEHDHCYKQDQSPRYHALTIAEKIAELLKIKILIGSATPSLETYYKAKNGEYELVELTQRANKKPLPLTQIIDLRQELKAKNFSIFSLALQHQLEQKLINKEQAILFLNRRGAASAVICRMCGHVVKCVNCEIPYTYHKKLSAENSIYNAERLICHHCGVIKQVPSVCPECKSPAIKYIGLGTQRIEAELQALHPLARTLRADRDTTGKRNQFNDIYNAFRNKEADILIGTQMIAFGLHLPSVNLVGIILADMGLTLPDYKSAEQTFQLITQVAGRAGRGNERGHVIIQTYLPNHYSIQTASAHDYKSFYEKEILIREQLKYPPFNKLIKLTITDYDQKKCQERTIKLFNMLNEKIKSLSSTKEPETSINYYPALIPRLNNKYRWHILLCGPNPASLIKQIDTENLIIDVDPSGTI